MVGPDHTRPGVYIDVPLIHINNQKTTTQPVSGIVASFGCCKTLLLRL